LRTTLEQDSLTAYPKTSGNKGAQLMVPIKPASEGKTSEYAKRIADDLQKALPDLVLSSMDRKARRGKVFIDWSQNNPAKTTIAPYSLRGIDRPTVSTPLTWDEVAEVGSPADLTFTAADIPGRLEEYGDLLADMDEHRGALPNRA
jgi:bifunctional non-homologous end joining protein LigD